MDTLPIITIIGGIALLVALFGGGIKAKEIEIPSISRSLRILSGLTGILLIGMAVRLSYPNLTTPPSMSPTISSPTTHASVSTVQPITETTSKPTALQTQLVPGSIVGDSLLNENFEDGKAGDFRFSADEWQVKDDGSGNQVLETNSSNYSLTSWTQADFGPSAMGDYSIEYRVKLSEYDLSQDTGSGLVSLVFRQGSSGSYVFVLCPYKHRFELNHSAPNGSWTPLDGGKGIQKYDFKKNTWYSIRVEVYGTQIKAFFEGNLLFAFTDSRLKEGGIAFLRGPNTIAQFDDVHVKE